MMIISKPKISDFKPYQFNKKAEFGTVKSKQLENGNTIKEFVPELTLHYMNWKRSIAQDNSIYGTDLEDTVMIVIRHNPKVNTKIECRLNGIVYDIVMDNVDDSNLYITYDILTLRERKSGR